MAVFGLNQSTHHVADSIHDDVVAPSGELDGIVRAQLPFEVVKILGRELVENTTKIDVILHIDTRVAFQDLVIAVAVFVQRSNHQALDIAQGDLDIIF